ncbi:MAG TPA: hypothetical protein VEX36_04650 [Thermoleophilaceae bacterium]|nr:hypothetical protein [Thermoleophilaceae bacterium]
MRTMTKAGAMAVTAAALLIPAGGASAAVEKTKPIVVDSGSAPDGSRYEHVVFAQRREGVARLQGDPKRKARSFGVTMLCKALRWPRRPMRDGGYACEGPGPRMNDAPAPTFSGASARFVQPDRTGEGVAAPDVVIAGQTAASVARMEVSYRDLAGNERRLPVDFARVSARSQQVLVAKLGKEGKGKSKRGGKAMRRAAKRSAASYEAYGVFTAFLPGADAARDQLAQRADAGDNHPGEPALGDPAWTGDLGGLTFTGNPCNVHDGWEGPFRVVAFDGAGRQLPDPRQPSSCP